MDVRRNNKKRDLMGKQDCMLRARKAKKGNEKEGNRENTYLAGYAERVIVHEKIQYAEKKLFYFQR